MDIQFPLITVPDPENWGISIPVDVDGARRKCLITTEAIQDLAGVKTADMGQLREFVDIHRTEIEDRIRRKLEDGAAGTIVIDKGDV